MSVPKQLILASVLAMTLYFSALSEPTFGAPSSIPPIHAFNEWAHNMVRFGRVHCDTMARLQSSSTAEERLDSTYYDAERVYYQIAIYTKDPSWHQCAALAERFYRDQHVLPKQGTVPGYWAFTRGLLLDYELTHDEQSKQAIVMISLNAAYSGEGTWLWKTASAVSARDVGYAIMNYVNAEKIGQPPRRRKELLIDQALDHIRQWVNRSLLYSFAERQPSDYLKPFFVAITLQALIEAYELKPDPRIPTAVAAILDVLWERAWRPSAHAFYYESANPNNAAPDLNLMIAPAYAWMYSRTADQKYLERGDLIFSGGITHAYLSGIKQFNQNYWWSFDYIKWRQQGASTVHP
jgi:hypothetical protein